MKLTKEVLRNHRIFNSSEIAKTAGNRVMITRGEYGWLVYGIGFKTDPEGPYYHHQSKAFSYIGIQNKAKALERAMAWAETNTDITGIPAGSGWERDVWGDWHPKGTLAKVEAHIEAERTARRGNVQ
jgi:hypothetical protein